MNLRRLFGGRRSRARNRSLSLDSRIEWLEQRTMLSGNVTAVVKGGDLLVRSDAAGNRIEIDRTDEGVVVRGVEGTLINGQNAAFVAFSGMSHIPRNLQVTLGAGDDILVVSGVQVGRDLKVATRGGSDRIGLSEVEVAGDLHVRGGSQATAVHVEDANVGGKASLRLRGGDNTAAVLNSRIAGQLLLRSRRGADAVLLADVDLTSGMRIRTGGGHDSVVFDGGAVAERSTIRTGAGSDFVFLRSVATEGTFNVRLGRGDDVLGIAEPAASPHRFLGSGGRGRDALHLSPDVGPDFGRFTRFAAMTTSVATDPSIHAGKLGVVNRIAALTDVLYGTSEQGDDFFLSLDLSQNDLIASQGAYITGATTLRVVAETTPGAVIEIGRNGTGGEVESTFVADASGIAVLDLPLLRDDLTHGGNLFHIRAKHGQEQKTESVNVHYAVGTVVRIDSTWGAVDVELLDVDAPLTVNNFLGYLDRYEGSIIHRSVHSIGGADFIVQGGGFLLDDGVRPLTAESPVPNEFDSRNSNLRGTVAMAFPSGNPNGGTSQWHINVADNAFLDSSQHTVFGRVIAEGMAVVDAWHNLETFNLIGPLNDSALATVPLAGYLPFTSQIAGTVAIAAGSSDVIGNGTAFRTELRPGAAVLIEGEVFAVMSIASDTRLTLNRVHTSGVTTGIVRTNATPTADQFVQLTGVSVIL